MMKQMCKFYNLIQGKLLANSIFSMILWLLYFLRREVESIQGSKLLSIADFHIGSEVTSLISHPTLSLNTNLQMVNKMYARQNKQQRPDSTGLAFGTRQSKTSINRSCAIIGTIDGSIGMLSPVDEFVFKRLYLLQYLMSVSLQHVCALNPRDYRLLKSTQFRLEKKKNVLDGSLLWRYVSLDKSQQEFLATSIGTSAATILDNLYEIESTSHFF